MSYDETEETWVYPVLKFETSTANDNPIRAQIELTTAKGTVTCFVTAAQLDQIAQKCAKAASALNNTPMRGTSQ
jgi:hypothetical protein